MRTAVRKGVERCEDLRRPSLSARTQWRPGEGRSSLSWAEAVREEAGLLLLIRLTTSSNLRLT